MIAKRKSTLLYILIIVLVVTGSVVYAAKISEISFTNWYETGSVDVRIRQYEVTGKGEVLSIPGQVMPNQDVSYIPRVMNLRAESYVRVKVEIKMDEEVANPIILENVLGFNKEWVQRGNYFYLTKSLRTNESSDLFRGFHVPKEWEQDTACGFTIRVTVDALQKEHVSPDFDSIAPWGAVKIEHAKQEDNIDYGIAKKMEVSPVMEYTELNGLESKTSDLFTNFNYFMAGDKYKDSLKMKNQSNHPIKLYFKTDTMETDLTSQMNVKYRVTDIDGNVFEKTPKVAGTYTLFIEHEEDGITNMATVEIQVKAPEKLTVKFNTNGGNSLADLSVYKYDTLAESTNDVTRYTTVRVDYDFLGWYMDSDLTQSFDVENTRVTENITLYAKWKNQYSNYAMLLSDGTLTFAYIKEDAVKRGTYNGKTIQDYYTGFDTADYTMETQVPWYPERLRVKNVEVEDSFTPKSMSYWFCDMQNCSAINIANINTKQDTKVKGIFRNMAALEQITVGSQWEWQQGNELPKPSRAEFDYADGKWYSDASGRGYDPEEMPAGTADTYYAFPIQRVLTGIEERAMDLYSLIDSNKSKLEQKSSAGFLKQSNFIHGYQSYTATSVKSKSSEGLLSKTFDAKNCQKPLGIVGYYCTGTNSTYLSPYRKFVNVSNKSMYYTVRNIHTKDATNIVPYVDVLYLGK